MNVKCKICKKEFYASGDRYVEPYCSPKCYAKKEEEGEEKNIPSQAKTGKPGYKEKKKERDVSEVQEKTSHSNASHSVSLRSPEAQKPARPTKLDRPML